MLTNELITLIVDEAGTQWSRVRAREALNRAQNEILSNDNPLMRIKPDPFFATTDGVYSYAASSVLYDSSDGTQGSTQYDVRSVRKVYTYRSDVTIFDQRTLDPASSKPNQVTELPTTELIESRIEVLESLAPSSSDCVVKWWEGNNPGDTTVVWRAEAYKWPTQLTSESIALSIPAVWHDNLLLYAVLKRLERREFGENQYMTSEYERLMRRFKAQTNRMPRQDLQKCYPREF